MGLRQTLNQNPALTTIGTALIVVAALVFVIMQFMGGGRAQSGPSNQTWFSDDDGATFFADDRSKVPPFDHNGKQAVRAYVYTCDGGKTRFVGWLQRYTPEMKKQMESQPGGGGVLEMEDRSGIEIKKPKAGKWVKQSDPAAAGIQDVTCPDGSTENLELVPDP